MVRGDNKFLRNKMLVIPAGYNKEVMEPGKSHRLHRIVEVPSRRTSHTTPRRSPTLLRTLPVSRNMRHKRRTH